MVADDQGVNNGINVDDHDDAAATGAAADEKATASEQKVEDSFADIATRVMHTMVSEKGREIDDVEGQAEVSKSRTSSSSEEERKYPGWRLALRRLVSSEKFQRLVTVLIVLNTLVLALDHHPMDNEFSTAIETCNLVFTLCFAVEMVVKVGFSNRLLQCFPCHSSVLFRLHMSNNHGMVGEAAFSSCFSPRWWVPTKTVGRPRRRPSTYHARTYADYASRFDI